MPVHHSSQGNIDVFRNSSQVVYSGLLAVAAPVPALAATTVASFDVRVTITAECKIGSGTNLDFGSHGVIDTSIDGSSFFNIQCTTSTPYDISLGLGTNAGSSLTSRYMTGTDAATVGYNLYKDALFTNVWGNVSPTNTVSATGNGAAQLYNVYGRIPAQTTPAAGAYTDTVAVTVTY